MNDVAEALLSQEQRKTDWLRPGAFFFGTGDVVREAVARVNPELASPIALNKN